MKCRRAQQLLSDYHDGCLRGREAVAVSAHMRDCPACRHLQSTVAAFEGKVREMANRQPDPRCNLPRSAVDRWFAEREGRTKARGWLLPATAAAAAAIFIALLSLGWWGHPHSTSQPPPRIAKGSLPAATPRNRHSASLHPPRVRGGELVQLQTTVRFAGPPAPLPETQTDSGPHAASRPVARVASGTVARPVDDLQAMNGNPLQNAPQWTPLPPNQWDEIEARVRRNVRVRDDFITIPFPLLATTSNQQIAEAVESYKREAAIVDPRLSHEVTCSFKATALSDLCDRLHADTGIQLSAGPSVADEKVTVFCEKLPLRDVMRQLSRPFGYTWLRSKKEGGEYRYELVQDLRSQLLEEELRNRDRDAALLDLEKEIDRYRPYLSLSPDEALARARTAAPEEKKLLDKLAGWGWGPVHMYLRLSPRELATLRAGQKLVFSADPRPGQQPLPADMERGVLQSVRDTRLLKQENGYSFAYTKDAAFPNALPPAAVPDETRASVDVALRQSELGQFTLGGMSGFSVAATKMFRGGSSAPYATGISPAVRSPDNKAANLRLSTDPALHRRVSVSPQSTCGDARRPSRFAGHSPASPPREDGSPTQTVGSGQPASEKKVDSADVLEALHQATGLPVVADYFTHLYRAETVSARNQFLFDLLNQLTDTMRLRWTKDGSWLQFRSASYYDDRLKEVPNRLLARWAAERRQHGALPLDEVLEIAQLSDAQLDATDMAEGARECFGLTEWNLARDGFFRPHLRYLAQLTPAQRQEAQSVTGLSFTRLTLAQQQQFISFAFPSAYEDDKLHSLEELARATLRLEHTQPGWFQWEMPVIPDWPRDRALGRGLLGLPPVRERTRTAVLQAAQRIDPQVSEAQIVPTELAVTVVYTAGSPRTGVIAQVSQATPNNASGWAFRLPEDRLRPVP